MTTVHAAAPQVLRVRNCATCCDQPTIPPDCPSCKGRGGFGPYQGAAVVLSAPIAVRPGEDSGCEPGSDGWIDAVFQCGSIAAPAPVRREAQVTLESTGQGNGWRIIEAADTPAGIGPAGSDIALTIEWPDGTESLEHVSDNAARVLGYVPGSDGPTLTLETPRMLVLSTSHVDRATATALDYGYTMIPAGCARRAHGWFIPIHDSWPADCPPDLRLVRKLAEASGCTWILLDRDGDTIAGLPSYDW